LTSGEVSSYGTAYVAGFGTTTFMKSCWTDKTGPNPFYKCKDSYEWKGKKYTVSGSNMYNGREP
jgi:hypothetical protein